MRGRFRSAVGRRSLAVRRREQDYHSGAITLVAVQRRLQHTIQRITKVALYNGRKAAGTCSFTLKPQPMNISWAKVNHLAPRVAGRIGAPVRDVMNAISSTTRTILRQARRELSSTL